METQKIHKRNDKLLTICGKWANDEKIKTSYKWNKVTCLTCQKMKKYTIHKIMNTFYTMCRISAQKIKKRTTNNWKEVTCKACLRLK